MALKTVRSVYQDEASGRSAILKFLPTGELFAGCIEDELVRFYGTRTLAAHDMTSNFISEMSFSASGQLLAASSEHAISVEDIYAGASVDIPLQYFHNCLFLPVTNSWQTMWTIRSSFGARMNLADRGIWKATVK
jgi:WD40 repeat protein